MKSESKNIIVHLHRTLTLQRDIFAPPLFRILILYSSISSAVRLLITKIQRSPSRVIVYFGLFDNSFVPRYLSRRIGKINEMCNDRLNQRFTIQYRVLVFHSLQLLIELFYLHYPRHRVISEEIQVQWQHWDLEPNHSNNRMRSILCRKERDEMNYSSQF